MTGRRRIGSVEGAARAFLRSLGELSDRDMLAAANLVALAKQIDDAETGSGAAAASRELRMVLGSLRDRVRPAGPPVTQGSLRLTQLAEARAKRIREAQEASDAS